ncbi:MAG: glycosyltransferase family 4 protein [bacterium]|nr:glycosyltransferase family 4 protein [bacterium]
MALLSTKSGTKNNVLLLASTFPRRENDTDPKFIFDLCRGLKNNYNIHVLCPHAPGTPTQEQFHGIHVTRFRYFFTQLQTLAYDGGILNRLRQRRWRYMLVPFFLLAELLATISLLRQHRFTVINAHWMIPQGLIAVLAKKILRLSVPVVCTLHGGDIFALQGAFLNNIKRFVLLRSDTVIVVSQAMRQAVIALGVPASKIRIIPMGVDLKKSFVPCATARKAKHLLFVGRFVEKKGLVYLLDALPLILAHHPDAHLTIVGHGPLEAALRQQVTSLGLDTNVTFHGAVVNTQLPQLYQAADIVIFPSIIDSRGDMEGFGLVMVEALGCACAVIATDLPAIHDIIKHKQTGVMIKQKDAQALAQAANELLDNPARCRALGSQGRQHVAERWDWEMTARKYEDICKALTSGC